MAIESTHPEDTSLVSEMVSVVAGQFACYDGAEASRNVWHGHVGKRTVEKRGGKGKGGLTNPLRNFLCGARLAAVQDQYARSGICHGTNVAPNRWKAARRSTQVHKQGEFLLFRHCGTGHPTTGWPLSQDGDWLTSASGADPAGYCGDRLVW